MKISRKAYIAKVKRFAKSKKGLKKIQVLAPEVAKTIEEHPEYLDIPQYYNDPRVAGNYMNYIGGKPCYVGESGNAILREAEHCYNFLTDSKYYGCCYNSKIKASFRIIAVGVTDPTMRELIEENTIKVCKPLLQWTDETALEYGNDKPIPEGQTRENIRPDICIYEKLRVERMNKLFEELN